MNSISVSLAYRVKLIAQGLGVVILNAYNVTDLS